MIQREYFSRNAECCSYNIQEEWWMMNRFHKIENVSHKIASPRPCFNHFTEKKRQTSRYVRDQVLPDNLHNSLLCYWHPFFVCSTRQYPNHLVRNRIWSWRECPGSPWGQELNLSWTKWLTERVCRSVYGYWPYVGICIQYIPSFHVCQGLDRRIRT
jgi:hypothetical protein